MSLTDTFAALEAEINAEVERRLALRDPVVEVRREVARMFARVLLTMGPDDTVDYKLWAQATVDALHELRRTDEVER